MTDKLNLIDTIARQNTLSTFSKILRTVGAKDLLRGEAQFTVFAPTDEAFGEMPVTTMNKLLGEDNKAELKSFLSYHVLPNKVMAASLAGLETTKTVSGETVAITDSNGLKVNGAGIQARNIEATNGVIHAIDTVLARPLAAAPGAPIA
jgi:uncharacterized surface protein with fasciclin (FAS1) repeats